MSYNPECNVIVGKSKRTQISELHKQIMLKQRVKQLYDQQKHLDNQWLGTKKVSCSTIGMIIYKAAIHAQQKWKQYILWPLPKTPQVMTALAQNC